jgi:uncharacterized protein
VIPGDSASTPGAAVLTDRTQRQTASVGALTMYFAATFALAWLAWFVADRFAMANGLGAGVRGVLYLPGTFTPALVALLLTERTAGPGGVRTLLSRLTRWEVGVGWYLFALGFMATVKLLAALGYRLVEGGWPAFGPTPVVLMLAAVALSTPFQVGEELGWRGYALPGLAGHLGMAGASVVVGVIWAAWHLPLFYLAGADMVGQPFPFFLLSVTALSVAMAWLYVGTGGSLLLVMVMHAAVNNTTGIVPASLPAPGSPWTLAASPIAWLTAGILMALAGLFLVLLRRTSFIDRAP